MQNKDNVLPNTESVKSYDHLVFHPHILLFDILVDFEELNPYFLENIRDIILQHSENISNANKFTEWIPHIIVEFSKRCKSSGY